MRLRILLALVCFGGLLGSVSAQPKGFNYDEEYVPKFSLPDPLKMENSKPVESQAQWETKRRPEILGLFEKHVYGAMPPALSFDEVTVDEHDSEAIGGKAIRKEITLSFLRKGKRHQFPVLLLVPKSAKGPVPAFVGYNFNGNHTVHADNGIRLSTVWNRKPGSVGKVADESTRGSSASRWQVEKILSRGYALITVYYGDVDPDFFDEFQNGIHQLFPEYQDRPDNWTSIGGWAWGLHRVMDYLEQEPLIDAKRVAVIGHSRLGKTSLWTGATDPRFGLVISNNSGCGGAALARRRFGETVARINTSFPHWFCKTHKNYNNHEDQLPVDQHQLIALMAPRAVYVASAEDDRWADPRGEFLSCVAASPVYELFNLEGMSTETSPAVNQPVGGRIGYHVRTGRHDVTAYDWDQYLDFADKHLGK